MNISTQLGELYVSRNNALQFAHFTRKNLEHIETAYKDGKRVHVVTHLINSLLGLVVFIWEKKFVNHIRGLELSALAKDGWPSIELTKGKCRTLGEFVRHLRNAIAHGRIKFSSDSPNLDEVVITIEDRRSSDQEPSWCARTTAEDLRKVCLNLVQLVDDTIG